MKRFFGRIILLIGILLMADSLSAQLTGNATYYSNRFHGRRTSSGAVYHKDSLTCAHKTLPFGTLLKVRNPRNGEEVVVKVTDRGPHRRDAVVDLSYAAASKIGLTRAGIARVEIEKLNAMPLPYRTGKQSMPQLQLEDPATGNYYSLSEWNRKIQLAARNEQAVAQNGAARLNSPAARRDSTPRWRVLKDKLSASNEHKASNEHFDYVKLPAQSSR